MPPKAVLAVNILATVTISGLSGMQGNTSMAKLNKQLVEQYRKIIIQLVDNQAVLKEQLDRQGYRVIKMPSVKQFLREVYKLKRFLTQVKIKIINKGVGLPIVIK